MNPLEDLNFDDFKNPTIWCFDLEQYNPNSHKLQVTVFANYKEKTYYADTIHIPTNTCIWLHNKWILHYYKNKYIEAGIIIIKDMIENHPIQTKKHEIN